MSIRATSRLILSTRSSKNNAIRRSCNAFSQRNYSGKTEWPPDGGRFDWRAVRDEVVAERRKAEPRKAPPPWAPKGFLVDAQPEPEIEREVVPEYGERPPPAGTDFDLGDFVPITPLPRVRRVDEATNSATGIGRRKTARAKVVITPGTGRFIVNGRHFIDYFPTYKTRDDVIQPLLATETANRFDIVALSMCLFHFCTCTCSFFLFFLSIFFLFFGFFFSVFF